MGSDIVVEDVRAVFSLMSMPAAIAICDARLAGADLQIAYPRLARSLLPEWPPMTRAMLFLVYALAVLGLPAAAEERTNHFDDPFLQATSAVARCPAPRPPGFTREEIRNEAHVRSHHGGSCYLSGRCRLPNSYLYDKEIIPRVAQYIQRDGRFTDTSVWVLGERRLVTLMGCVQTKQQAQELERAVLLVDDVMGVVNYLTIGTQESPKYPLAK